MKKFLRLLLILGLASVVAAQETPKHIQKIYKVVFVLYEVEDGKKINERTYTVPVTSVDGSPRESSITVGTRVPIVTGTTGDNTVFQYLDVGLKIDCNVSEQDNKFIVHGEVELSSLVLPDQGGDQRLSRQPVVRRIKQSFTTLVPPGRPTLVTTADDINSKKRMEVEVTATRLE
jgi:hypothetical protein